VPSRALLFPALAVLAAGSLILCGCNREKAKEAEAKPPEVFIEEPSRETVTESQEFTGQTVAIETVEIRARVSGYLEKNFFKDGDLVPEGAPLFLIDERPYRAEFDRTTAALAQAEAHLERVKRQEERATKLFEKKSISQEDFDTARFDRAEAEAAAGAARAQKEMAALNLSFTKINAKVSGRISRRMVDPGNLIQADVTPLTTIVSIDPMYAYFDVDERTLLRLRRMMETEHSESALSSQVAVEIRLADEESAPIWGKINFLDNVVDASTGTLRARAVIDNPKGMLSPGLFVRLRVPVGAPRSALTVHEEALQTNQGQRFLWVLNDNDEARQQPVKVGWLTDRGRRVILEGVQPSDRVIVKGVQRVREKKKVAPEFLESPPDMAASNSTEPRSPRPSGGGR
jgi:RND family efflux transporter MFP subunit